jgi:hypothetical protein
MIKETEAELLLKIADLPRQRRLPNAQVHRRFRHRAKVGDRDKGFQAPEIHGSIVFRSGMGCQHNYALDDLALRWQCSRMSLE